MPSWEGNIPSVSRKRPSGRLRAKVRAMSALAWLDAISVPLGPSTYAEPFDPASPLKMPANALVNVAYLVVAAFWLWEAARWPSTDPRSGARSRFIAFALLGAAYAPIQFWRITSQSHTAAVLDQWITLPFFAFLGAWNVDRRSSAASPWRLPAILVLSVASYALVALVRDGFVVALALHLAFAVATSVDALRLDRGASARPFALALLCCTGFVLLKEADFALAAYVPFQRLTGHFWSKVCDALQIHFALRFVAAGYLARATA